MKPNLFGKDRICAVVAAPTAREVQALFLRALMLSKTVELRLDWLRGERQLMSCLPFTGYAIRTNQRGLVSELFGPGHPPICRISTCRGKSAGGQFRGKWTVQLSMLSHAAGDKSEWCDIEVEFAERFESENLKSRLALSKRLISFHDFRGTPQDLKAVVHRLDRCGGDAIKIATHCTSISDSLRVLKLTKGRKNVIAVPMGEIGLPARVLALREGSALAYASVGEKTAPGQLTLDEMKNLYRADKLTRKTKVYGVIGNPVSHSLSPVMQNAGFHARKIDAVYLPFLVKDLKDFLRAIKPLGIAGFSVTLPWKEKILRHLDDCDPLAAQIGAINTVVVRSGGRLFGINTDYVGVLRALEKRVQLSGSRVLLFGAGGAARAAAFALAQGGAVVCICARRPKRAEALAKAVGGVAIRRGNLRREFFDAIINATPVGMSPRAGESPLTARELNTRVVMDMVYRPQKTKLLALAARRGIATVSGIEMFMAQGTAQWEIWTGRRAPESVMRKAVLAKLKTEN
ncbi:MAG: shikimate dehydrogenase [Acidobacteria bacterium]|nr:shikimate dehydrogenase [Acidobacteriota bacterium]